MLGNTGWQTEVLLFDSKEYLWFWEAGRIMRFSPPTQALDTFSSARSGIEGVARQKKAHPKVEALMLTVFDDDNRVFQAVCAGASGYLLKKEKP